MLVKNKKSLKGAWVWTQSCEPQLWATLLFIIHYLRLTLLSSSNIWCLSLTLILRRVPTVLQKWALGWDLDLRSAAACDRVSSATPNMVVTQGELYLQLPFLCWHEEEEEGGRRLTHARRGWYFVCGHMIETVLALNSVVLRDDCLHG